RRDRLVRLSVRPVARFRHGRGGTSRPCRARGCHPGLRRRSVSWLAAVLVVAAMVAGALLAAPAARRTGLGPWHPAVAWIALELVFFGIGSAILAAGDGRSGSALYAAAAVLVFGVSVGGSYRLALSCDLVCAVDMIHLDSVV